MGFTVYEEIMSVDECIALFERGGEWRCRQVIKITGWTKSMLYRYINEGKIPAEAVVRRSIRGTRIKGEAIAALLRALQSR